jgi:hypothetical protein
MHRSSFYPVTRGSDPRRSSWGPSAQNAIQSVYPCIGFGHAPCGGEGSKGKSGARSPKGSSFPLLACPFVGAREVYDLHPARPKGIQRNKISPIITGYYRLPVPILATLLATGMPSSDGRTRSGVPPPRGYDYSPCFTPGFTVIVLFLTVLFLLYLPL